MGQHAVVTYSVIAYINCAPRVIDHNRAGYRPGPGQSASCFQLRQTETGKAGFIASSKNKTRKQTVVLSESDVYLSSPPEPAQLSDAQLNSIQ
jgi:hypothetical protein